MTQPYLTQLTCNDREFSTYGYDGNGRKTFFQAAYLTDKERKELIQNTCHNATLVFEYYLRSSTSKKAPVPTDAVVADQLCMTETQVASHRRALTRIGWLRITKSPRNRRTGERYWRFYLGKSAVRKLELGDHRDVA